MLLQCLICKCHSFGKLGRWEPRFEGGGIVFDAKDFGDLSFVVLGVVPRDAQFVRDIDVIVSEDPEDCRHMRGRWDNPDEVIQVMMHELPSLGRLQNPLEGLREEVEEEG
jgi:hypothetical protein